MITFQNFNLKHRHKHFPRKSRDNTRLLCGIFKFRKDLNKNSVKLPRKHNGADNTQSKYAKSLPAAVRQKTEDALFYAGTAAYR